MINLSASSEAATKYQLILILLFQHLCCIDKRIFLCIYKYFCILRTKEREHKQISKNLHFLRTRPSTGHRVCVLFYEGTTLYIRKDIINHFPLYLVTLDGVT